MDITTFMTWFVSQVVRIFTYTFTTLNNITFGGTSLLRIIIFINVIVPFIYLVITIPRPNKEYREAYKESAKEHRKERRKGN